MIMNSNRINKEISAKRYKRKATMEEESKKHGASKLVRVSLETEYEETYSNQCVNGGGPSCIVSPEPYIVLNKDSILSSVTDIENVRETIGRISGVQRNKGYYLPEQIISPDKSFTEYKKQERLPVKNTLSIHNTESLDNKNSSKLSLKSRMSQKAAEILKEFKNERKQEKEGRLVKYGYGKNSDLVVMHNVERYEDNMKYREYEIISAEYQESLLYDENLDFSMFGNPKDFEESVNLSGKTLVECIKAYVEQKSIKNKLYRKRYRLTLTYILLLEEEWKITLTPQVIGVLFGTMFERYLYNQGLAPHSVEQLIYNLRAVLKWSSRYGAKVKADMEDIRYRGVDAKPKIALSDDDISRIYWFDIDALKCRKHHKKTLKIVRDHFVLACFLGQRYSDTVRLDQTNFHGQEIFKVTQQKTGTTAVLEFNRLYPVYPSHVKEILERYDYKSPWQGDIANYNRYLHELMRHIGFNDDVKHEYKVAGCIIKKTYKKWELITSHVARRSFITNAVKRNINTQYIKRASGHHSDESFGKYVLLD